jgi:hypothetical protein
VKVVRVVWKGDYQQSRERPFLDSKTRDALLIRGVAESDRLRHDDLAVFDGDGRIDEVLRIVLIAGGNIAGNGKIWQGAECDVVRPADAVFVHAAAPHRNPPCLTEVVDLAGLKQATHPSRLDIDDPTAPEIERLARILRRVDALVQANGGAEGPL